MVMVRHDQQPEFFLDLQTYAFSQYFPMTYKTRNQWRHFHIVYMRNPAIQIHTRMG